MFYTKNMPSKNFTSIDDLVKKHTTHTSSYAGHPKEGEPVSSHPKTHEVHEVVEHEVKDEAVKPFVQTKKEKITLPEELKAIGTIKGSKRKNTKGFCAITVKLLNCLK
jgi:hypothetical protein